MLKKLYKMLSRTHIAIAFFLLLIIWNFLEEKLIFAVLFIFATFLPDIDGINSFIKSKFLAAIFKHRGFFHSLTFLVVLSAIIFFVFSKATIPFFLGYSVHLLADSFTIEGIKPYWPFSKKLVGKIVVGSKKEKIIFYFILAFVVLAFLALIF